MSYQIITRITITPDLRVMVRMAANNIRPLDFRYDEVAFLTETLLTDGIDKYEAWERCREDKEYERGLLLRMRGFLHYQPVPCRCHLEYQRSTVRRIYVGYISFSRQRRRIFPSVLDAQAALVAKGWNPENFRIVEEDTQNLKSQKQ